MCVIERHWLCSSQKGRRAEEEGCFAVRLPGSFEVVLKGIYRACDTVSFMHVSLDRTSLGCC